MGKYIEFYPTGKEYLYGFLKFLLLAFTLTSLSYLIMFSGTLIQKTKNGYYTSIFGYEVNFSKK